MKKVYRFSFLFVIFMVLILCYTQVWAETAQAEEEVSSTVKGEVLQVLPMQNREIEYSGGSIQEESQMLEVRIIDGRFKNKVITAENPLNFDSGGKYKGLEFKPGDEVFLILEENEGGEIEHAYVSGIARGKYLFYLVVAFIVVLLMVGRTKGLKAVISLAITCAAVVKILLPLILKGYDPVYASVGVCIGIIAVSLVIISGISKKTLAAIVGTTGGVIASGGIAYLVGTVAKLTGFGDEESQMLMYIPQDVHFDFRGLLFAGIIIGALGAAMDVGMSIASAMNEIKAANPKIKKADLMKAGMNIGRDMMATMSNTLILAYAGGSLQLLLLLMAYDVPLADIVNHDVFASEIVRSLAGSIGLVLTIPVTALAAALLSEKKQNVYKDDSIDFRY